MWGAALVKVGSFHSSQLLAAAQSKRLLHASTRPQVLPTQLVDVPAMPGDLHDLPDQVLGHTDHGVHVALQDIARIHRHGRKHRLALGIQRHRRVS